MIEVKKQNYDFEEKGLNSFQETLK